MQRHLYLDLEETLTTPFTGRFNWSYTFLNVNRISAVIRHWQPTEVHLFSFAIRDKQDVTDFARYVQPNLEAVYGIKFASVPTVDDFLHACCVMKGLSPSRVEVQDFMDFWNKQESFRLWCRHQYALNGVKQDPVHAVLIDDVVLEEEWSYPSLNLTGSVFNVDAPRLSEKFPLS